MRRLRLPVALDVRRDIGGPEEQPPTDSNPSDLPALAEPEQRRPRDAAELGAGCLLREQRRPGLAVACRFVSVHSDSSFASAEASRINGDETRPRLYDECPEDFDRLEVFQWEWISDRDAHHRAWVQSHGKPVTVEHGVYEEGLREAAEVVAAVVQLALLERPSPLEPLELFELWGARLGYLNPLIFLGGHALAKQVDAQAAPNGKPLTICVGSSNDVHVEAWQGDRLTHHTLRGFGGCGHTFPDAPYAPGRMWPRWCPDCRRAKTNAKNAAIAELRRRVARAVTGN